MQNKSRHRNRLLPKITTITLVTVNFTACKTRDPNKRKIHHLKKEADVVAISQCRDNEQLEFEFLVMRPHESLLETEAIRPIAEGYKLQTNKKFTQFLL